MVTETEIANKLTIVNSLLSCLNTAKASQRQPYASAIARQKGWFMEHGLRLTPVFANKLMVCYTVQGEDRCSI